MTVHVFTRHCRTCAHRKDRSWKRCACTKWMLWHHRGKMYRQSSNSRDWNVAAKLARNIEDKYERAALGKPAKPENGITLEGAVRVYLVDRQSQHLSSATLSKLETIFQKQMVTWFHDLDIRFLRDVSLPQLIAWRGSWSDGPLAARKKQERVKGFFWFCWRNKWISENPALGLSKIKVTAKAVDVLTRQEFNAVLDATSRYGRTDAQRARIRALLLLMRWSGLAIRDAVTLKRARLSADDTLLLYRSKTGFPVHCPIPPEIAATLRNVPPGPRPNPAYFFWSGNGDPKSAVADWQRAFRRLFKLADLKNADGTTRRVYPHVLRHTFATQCLASGVPLIDVAMMLGHSSTKTTEKHYSHWIKQRSDNLTASVRKAWEGQATA
jgi:integrase/recombinase XerD